MRRKRLIFLKKEQVRLDNIPNWVYNIIVTTKRQEQEEHDGERRHDESKPDSPTHSNTRSGEGTRRKPHGGTDRHNPRRNEEELKRDRARGGFKLPATSLALYEDISRK